MLKSEGGTLNPIPPPLITLAELAQNLLLPYRLCGQPDRVLETYFCYHGPNVYGEARKPEPPL